MRAHEQRLRALEQAKRGSQPILIFRQDTEQPEWFTGQGGERYTEAQLESLAASATVIKIVYVEQGVS